METLLPAQAGAFLHDASLFRHVNDLARTTPWLHEPARLFATYGVVLFAVLLLWSWWSAVRADDQRAVGSSLWAPLGMLLALAINQPIGRLVGEPRPYAVLGHVLVLVHRTSDFSFPSDHAVMAGAVAAGVLLAHRTLAGVGLVAVVAALLMAFTRVYVGAHFPGDVVAGLALGAVVTLIGHVLTKPLLLALVRRLAGTPLRRLVGIADRRPAPAGTPAPR
ncbi:phosphatase PAP2 family protein [Nocardioides sp. KIGAM211]|uniref:Phosphatase PAP2 family protein n=1 Tax=Nocardioides luti TaxID=2761101 RepID=A0A7X0RKB9_9ACTN|nr:phosphatase PAP2 family protein [Nocardioides luti]MBB6629755.1 phosphatase PAP2 family protein [Nocardioides luti]